MTWTFAVACDMESCRVKSNAAPTVSWTCLADSAKLPGFVLLVRERERDNAEDFAEFVNGKQYGVAKVSELEDGRYRILVLITMPVAQHLIYSVSGFMPCLSRVFLIDYQGWGSVVQRS